MNNKKIIFQVTKTYMKKNKRRTVITFAGILVMVVLMTAVFIGKDTVMTYMQKAVEADKGKWHVQVFDVGLDEIEQIENLECIDKLEVSKPLGYTEFAQTGNPVDTPFLELKGYSGELFDWMNIHLIEGRYPENDHEIIISERAIKEGSDIKVGDTIEVDAFRRYLHAFISEEEEKEVAAGKDVGFVNFMGGFYVCHGDTVEVPAHFPYYEPNETFEIIHKPTGLKGTFTVVGIMQAPYYETRGQGGYIALTKTDDIVPVGDKANVVCTLDVKSHQEYEGEIAKILNSVRTPEEMKDLEKHGSLYVMEDGERIPVEDGRIEVNDMLLTFNAKGGDQSFNFLMIFFQAFFIILITAASLILIYNVFAISYKERSRYLGMLSSVGATRKQKRWSVYYEVFTLLAIALPVGIILGLFAVKGAVMMLYPHFSMLINSIATNVIMGRHTDIPFNLVISPLNILFVIVFSIIAVYVSALIPARKISKVGPIESIRGNESTGRMRKKGFRTNFGLMKKGRSERLLASASVGRNRHSTKGIIRSITAFVTLTLVTAFSVRSFVDVIKCKTETDVVSFGEHYESFAYLFNIDDEEQYNSAKEDILTSDEVTDYAIVDIELHSNYIKTEEFSDDYTDCVRKIIGSYYPDGIPQEIEENFFGDSTGRLGESFGIITFENDDFNKVAANAGLDPEKLDDHTILIYDTVSITTDDYMFRGDGAVEPGYTMYTVKNPLKAGVGDTIDLYTYDYDEKKQESIEVKMPMTIGGYIKAEDISEYYTLRGSSLWIIMSEETRDKMYEEYARLERANISERYILFSINNEDSNLIRRLSNIKNEFGDSAIKTAGLISGLTDFKKAITSIIKIVAVCFTLLIAIICILNLYNSVMGRKLSRHQELSVLYSMGMTDKQKRRMLLLENARLLVRAFIYSGVITSVFVVCLRRIINIRFGRMIFTLPGWIMAVTALTSIAALVIFTAVSYRETGKKQLIDEIRTETV